MGRCRAADGGLCIGVRVSGRGGRSSRCGGADPGSPSPSTLRALPGLRRGEGLRSLGRGAGVNVAPSGPLREGRKEGRMSKGNPKEGGQDKGLSMAGCPEPPAAASGARQGWPGDEPHRSIGRKKSSICSLQCEAWASGMILRCTRDVRPVDDNAFMTVKLCHKPGPSPWLYFEKFFCLFTKT